MQTHLYDTQDIIQVPRKLNQVGWRFVTVEDTSAVSNMMITPPSPMSCNTKKRFMKTTSDGYAEGSEEASSERVVFELYSESEWIPLRDVLTW